MHPVMDVTAQEPPVLSDFRCRQFTDSGEFIDRGLRHSEKPSHFHHREDFSLSRGDFLGLNRRCCRYFIIHDN